MRLAGITLFARETVLILLKMITSEQKKNEVTQVGKQTQVTVKRCERFVKSTNQAQLRTAKH